MPRILDATCDSSGKVSIEGHLVNNAVILSEGKKTSTGVALLDHDKVTYVTSNATDIKALITAVESMMTSVIAILTAHDSVTVSPGASAAAIASLSTLKTQFGLTKDQLK
jgi:N-methylhydantoinase B/oxoprolinase/acetone carboxylase alpha subunit